MRTVDQLLFGYRAGHELIAGSLELTGTQLHEVMPHTDAGFDSAQAHQLVGTWIGSAQRYLLCRIWPAPEMARTGAVWAHALMISNEDLHAGPLTGLPALLRRPTDTLDGYGAPLAWPALAPAVPVHPRLGRALAEAAMAGDPRPRTVLWNPSEQAQDALIALLQVTAPARRPQLSFRTRERARGGMSRYRVQVASALGGDAESDSELVIDAREHVSPRP
jgi:hypothetical protein